MTSKISWFNKGIYKSTVKRHLWGGIIFFVLLFLNTNVDLLVRISVYGEPDFYSNALDELLPTYYSIVPMLMAFGVASVAAPIVYRFALSKQTAIFVHSLPVSRTENFVSTLLGAFTVMAAPVIANGLILTSLCALTGTSYMTVASCLLWIVQILLALFLFFSCSTLASMLCGNTFGAIAINILLNLIGLILAGGFTLLSNIFIYGYNNSTFLLKFVGKWHFFGFLFGEVGNLSRLITGEAKSFDWFMLVVMLVIASALYVASWLLYKKRRLENVEEFAGFRCLNNVFKYLITFGVTVLAFSIALENTKNNLLVTMLPVVIVSVLAYFVTEMILKKTPKVWKAYKGYLIFAAGFTTLVCFFAFTSFFGYETKVPSVDSVETVKVERMGYRSWRYTEDFHEGEMHFPEVKKIVTDFHQKHISEGNIPLIDTDLYDYGKSGVRLTYKMKNGGVISREYYLTEDEYNKFMETLYGNIDYKWATDMVFVIQDKDIVYITTNNRNIVGNDAVAEFMNCVRQDVLEMSYAQRCPDRESSKTMRIEITFRNEKLDYNPSYVLYLNEHFSRTLKWLDDNK